MSCLCLSGRSVRSAADHAGGSCVGPREETGGTCTGHASRLVPRLPSAGAASEESQGEGARQEDCETREAEPVSGAEPAGGVHLCVRLDDVDASLVPTEVPRWALIQRQVPFNLIRNSQAQELPCNAESDDQNKPDYKQGQV